MPITEERRKHDRVEFLLVPVERDQVPVWLFKPASREDDVAGLIVDVGDGGLKVLTSAAQPLDFTTGRIDLLLGEEDGVAPFSGRVRRIWTAPYSKFGNVSGFEFLDASPLAAFLAEFKPDQARRAWVRCLLVEEATAVA